MESRADGALVVCCGDVSVVGFDPSLLLELAVVVSGSGSGGIKFMGVNVLGSGQAVSKRGGLFVYITMQF